MNIETAFGKVLRKVRNERNLSQETLGLMSELDRTYISLLERGKRKASIATIFSLGKSLNIKPSKLISMTEKLL